MTIRENFLVTKQVGSTLVILTVLAVLAIPGWQHFKSAEKQQVVSSAEKMPIPVLVESIRQGTLHLRLILSGTLEARAEFVVAPKVGGRIKALNVDLSDPVTRGQLVAELDNDEAFQAVMQAKADLAVASANQAEAKSALEIAIREFERIKILKQRGIASDSQYDTAMANQLAKHSRLDVARAQMTRAEAFLEAAGIRLGYTRVTADWSGGDNQRLVADRYVDAGQTVPANTPLLLISEIEPITGIVHIIEKDYASLKPGQPVTLTTDAYPGEVFDGKVDRIAPIFNQTTRQARVELEISNPDLKLKPGMFIRATIDVRTVSDVTIVPESAITSRDDEPGIFVINELGTKAVWRPVKIGIIEAGQVQVTGNSLSGRVVTLGQHLLQDGSDIHIPGPDATSGSSSQKMDSSK